MTGIVNTFCSDPEKMDEELLELSQANCQALFDKLFTLPVESNEEGVFAVLPAPTTAIPRAKPVCLSRMDPTFFFFFFFFDL
jgi:regulator of ribosome biosynthesis